MKDFSFVFLLVGFLHSIANPIYLANIEGLGRYGVLTIIVSDIDKIAQYSKLKNLSERSLIVKTGNDAYEEGVKFLQQGKSKDAITAFKTAFKNYKRVKYDEDALSFVNVQLAISHAISNEARDQKKVSRYMDLLTKGIFKEKIWAYNIILKSR